MENNEKNLEKPITGQVFMQFDDDKLHKVFDLTDDHEFQLTLKPLVKLEDSSILFETMYPPKRFRLIAKDVRNDIVNFWGGNTIKSHPESVKELFPEELEAAKGPTSSELTPGQKEWILQMMLFKKEAKCLWTHPCLETSVFFDVNTDDLSSMIAHVYRRGYGDAI